MRGLVVNAMDMPVCIQSLSPRKQQSPKIRQSRIEGAKIKDHKANESTNHMVLHVPTLID